MMQPDRSTKSFDCVAFMRKARARLSARMATMEPGELQRWLRSRRYSDPALQRLADRLRTGEREDGKRKRSGND